MNALKSFINASLETQQMDEQSANDVQDDQPIDTMVVGENRAAEAVQELNTADETFAALEQIALALESQREVGLTTQAAQFLHIGIEQQCRRVGLEGCESLPALESFDRGRLATVLSLEEVGDRVNKVWEYLKTQFLRVVNAIKNFFKSLFGGKKSAEESAKKIEEAVAKLPAPGEAAKSDDAKASNESVSMEFKGASTAQIALSESAARKLHLNGKLDDVIPNLRKAIDYCQAMAQEGAEIEVGHNKFGEQVIAMLNASNETNFDEQLEKIVDSLPVPEPKNHPHVTNDEGYQIYRSNQMIGAVTFVIRRAKLQPGDEGLAALAKKVSGIRLTRVDAAHQDVATDIAQMTREQGNQLINCVRDIITLSTKLDKSAQQLDSDEKAFTAALSHVSPHLQGEHARKLSQAVREFMKASMSILMRDGILLRYSTELVRAAEEWAVRSAR